MPGGRLCRVSVYIRPPDVIGPQAKPVGLTFRYKAARPMPPTEDFCSISPQSHKTSTFWGVPNTGQHSISSIIPDDPNDAMHAGDAKLEIAEKE